MWDKKKLIRLAIYDKETGCLNSLKSKNKDGYPQVWFDGRTTGVHRVMLELRLGRKLASDEFAIHKCNNRRCISTAIKHIVKGDNSQNMLDAVEAGTHHMVSKARRPRGQH